MSSLHADPSRAIDPARRPSPLALAGASLALLTAAGSVAASTGDLPDGEDLRRQIEALTERLDTQERELRELRSLPAAPQAEAPDDEQAPSPVRVGWDPVLTFTSPDDMFSLSVGGRIQARYEYERREGDDDHTSFSFRRIRPDFRGHAYTRDLTWRVAPELSRTASLRDAWADYHFSDTLRLRLGQYGVPFSWEWDSSSSRHQFTERSVANDEFQWADGRDIGLMAHGRLSEDVRYAVGVFGGEGRNVSQTSTVGHLFTGRVSWTAEGRNPTSEALVEPVEGRNIAFGAGAGLANRNAARDWAPEEDGQTEADVVAVTADGHFQADLYSVHAAGYFRHVDPRRDASSYRGYGLTAQAGMLLIPERLFASLRYSYAEPDTDVRAGRTHEFLAGAQVFHFGHNSKVSVEVGRQQQHDGDDWLDTDLLRLQYQLLF